VSRQTVGSTLAALAARYLSEQRSQTKPTTHREESRLWSRSIIPQLGAETALGALKVARWHTALAGSPYAANRALNSLSHALDLAVELRWIDRNPCRGIRRYPERCRLRYPERDELVRLDVALARLLELGHVTEPSADAIRVLSLTGRRLHEVLRLAWRPGVDGARGWVDLERGIVHLTDTKTGLPEELPLSAKALELLGQRSRGRAASPWVFPSARRPDRPLAGLQRAWERACELAGVTGACIHSLRHSFATRGLDAGIDSRLLMGLLGHRDRRSLDRYQHPTVTALRRAADALDALTATA
jgi:integrase